MNEKNQFIFFQTPIDNYVLPERFTFPFNHEPHILCKIAAKELQEYLERQLGWGQDFGIKHEKKQITIGKMFGILLVENAQKEIGYLAAFSGQLEMGTAHQAKFVPPVFDRLTTQGFFKKGEEELNQINQRIDLLEKDPQFLAYQVLLEEETRLASSELATEKQKAREAKAARKIRRQKGKKMLEPAFYEALEAELSKESIKNHFHLKDLSKHWKKRLAAIQQKNDVYLEEINLLKKKRKQKSADLQQKLFEQYVFLNQAGQTQTLFDIFKNTLQIIPPSGAGDCSAPKLIQYAFQHNLRPVAMAEFWWGQSPKSEIRKHGQFYPACRGKCEPILEHMLAGIEMDDNPMLVNKGSEKQIEIIYEDDDLLIVNKPTELLSVPGKNIQDSVFLRMKQQYPEATGPLLVHRLDMSTSGLMLIAKSKETHKILQSQFLKRTIQKRYVALLEGEVSENEGVIDLPLRVDLDDRPRQLVCYEHGKSARTLWKVIERTNQQTKVHFFPVTGRTHQLRVHAAHPLGLNTPIFGDDLYGNKANRLHLQADFLEFTHPSTDKVMRMEIEAAF